MVLLSAVREVRTIKALLTGAEREARTAGDDLPGPEHLLLSALDLGDGSAAQVLGHFGVDAPALRAAIEQVHAAALAATGLGSVGSADPEGGGASPGPASGPFRSTPQAQQVFQEAVTLSKSVKPSRLRGGHVVAAVCSLEHGTAARALAALGINRGQLRAVALTEVADG